MTNQFIGPEGDLERLFITEYWLVDQWIGDELRVWGSNAYDNLTPAGQLGINVNTIDPRLTPVTTFAGGTNWKQISCGSHHTAAIKTDGTLWIWGRNYNGQLGINDNRITVNRSTPVTTFAGGTNWKQVACGDYHTAAIKTDGTLWTWGLNVSGQLGNNSLIDRSTPVTTFAGGNNWKQVDCSYFNMAAIKTDGTLWVWGAAGYSGGLGNVGGVDICTPVTTFAGGTNWKQVSVSSNDMAAIKTDGTLWVWGRNYYGQLGINSINIMYTPVTTFAGGNNWKSVCAKSEKIFAIKTDGTLWALGGFNDSGDLGINSTNAGRSTPVTTFAGGNNWKSISSGRMTAAVKTDGTLWVWGNNAYGQLGTNDTTNRRTPITTFAGGTNWKQVSVSLSTIMAVTSGTDPVL